MIKAPRMLMIGPADRSSGKTELACSLIDRFSANRDIVAIKVTTVKKGDQMCARSCEGCDVCTVTNTNYTITEEVDLGRGKDTEQMLAAGAKRVLWMRVLREHIDEGARALMAHVDEDTFVICESNSLRFLVDPGLFLMVRHKRKRRFKESADAVRAHVDRVITYDGSGFDLDLEDISLLADEWALQTDAAAIVLAGGMSRRMKTDKSMLLIDGAPMIEHIHRQLRSHFKQTLVSANDAAKYAFLETTVVHDHESDQGPLMGITSALAESRHELNFVTACDMPNVDIPLVRRMLREAEGYDAVVPIANGEIEPLFAIYRRSVIEPFQQALADGTRKIRTAYDQLRVNYLDVTESGAPINLNTREDYDGFISQATTIK